MKQFLKSATVLVCAALFAVACGKSDDDSSPAATGGLLEYIPADSPYVFGQLGPLDEDVLDALEPSLEKVMQAYRKVIDAFIASDFENAEGSEMDEESAGKVRAAAGVLSELMSVDGMRSVGIERDDLSAFYGNGLLPVFRAQLSNPAAMETLIERIETEIDEKMQTATIDNISYRYAGDDGHFVIAIVDEQMVITVVPENASDGMLRSQLGLEKPASSMADTGELQTIAKEYGYLNYGVGFLSIERLASVFVEEPNAMNAELLDLAEYDAGELTDICKAEIMEVAGIMPRIVAGLTQFDTEKLSAHVGMEMRPDIAAGVATLIAPVQGLGTVAGDLLSFGMSLDLVAAREFALARLDALEADPYECELFAEAQADIAETRATLNQPLPPIVYSFKGFMAVVDKLEGMDLANEIPPTSADASFLVAADNPQGLVAMGAMFSPEIASMELQPDGKPQALELPPMSPVLAEAFVAMTDASLGVSVGATGEDRLGDLMQADFAEPSPFFSMDMDAKRYYELIADAIEAGEPVDDGEEVSPEMQEALEGVTRAIAEIYDRERATITFTERGIEMSAESTFDID